MIRGGGRDPKRILDWCSQQLPADLQVPCPHAVGQQAEVPDAHEAAGHRVHQESPQELGPVQGHGARAVVVGVVLVFEGDRLVVG